MGADRYTTCPRCVYEYEAETQALTEEIAEQYPALSMTAREALLPVLADERGLSEPDREFREDYEFAHGDNDRDVRVVYTGTCGRCGLQLKIDETHVIWTPESDA